VTVKSDGSSAIDDLRLFDTKISLYLIGFLFSAVDYRNFLEYPVIVHLTDMLSGTNYSANKVKRDFSMTYYYYYYYYSVICILATDVKCRDISIFKGRPILLSDLSK